MFITTSPTIEAPNNPTALIIGSTQAGAAPRFELFREFRGYMAGVAEERGRNPGEDLISLLVHAQEEEGVLDPEQVVGFSSLLLAAGSETTTNLIGNALLALRANPEQAALLRADPGRIPQLLEETLRYDSPIQMVFRTASRDVEVRGTKIPQGSQLAVLIGSANRDERRFENPDAFDIGRNTQGHLSFGFGQHFCLGSALARLEARAALEALVPELPRFERPTQARELVDSFLVRGLRRLELRLAA